MDQLVRSKSVSIPTRFQAWFPSIRDDVIVNFIVSGISGVLGGSVIALITQQWIPIVGGAVFSILGWVLRMYWDKKAHTAQAAVDQWEWYPSNSVVITGEGAEILSDGSVEVYLRVSNRSPIRWSVRGGKIENFRLGGSCRSTAPLYSVGIVPGSSVLLPGESTVVHFRGPCPTLDGNERWWPMFIGDTLSPNNPDARVAGYVEVTRGFADDPAVVIPQMRLTAARMGYNALDAADNPT